MTSFFRTMVQIPHIWM